ncbi:MAG: acyl-CoA desaturase [Flavobacteriales bacterium]|nr:acyl-CoA desaturase [Flavobacteriales bacterium]
MGKKGPVKFVPLERSAFYPTLKARVEAYFKEHGLSRHANATLITKAAILISLYIVPFLVLLLLQPSYGIGLALWALMGFGLAGIGMSVMHDANHGAFSKSERVNWWLGHTLNLCGGSAHNWKLQHNILHHTYTNVTHVDEDIEDRLVLKFSPHTERRWFHRIQWIYATFFYGLLTLYWVLAKDLIQFAQFARDGVDPGNGQERRMSLARIIAMKVVYFAGIIGLPIALGVAWWQVITGFLIMHFIAGMILTLVFQLAHTVEGTTHPLPDEHGTIRNDWAVHQLETTMNFSRDNKWIGWYVGGLNFQIEHHLFPRVAHVHYPAIAPIVKRTAEEFGVAYRENPTLISALRSHYAMLHRLGLPGVNDAIG